MLGRCALAVLLVGAILVPGAGASCATGSACSTDARAGPGDCYASSSRYAEDRTNEVNAGALDAQLEERCAAWGDPATHVARILSVSMTSAGVAQATITWAGSENSCTLTLAIQATNVGARSVQTGCPASPPWIFQPVQGYPALP